MSKYLDEILNEVREYLRDEFKSGVDLTWEADELKRHVGRCLREVSLVSPYEVKETVTTVADTRDISIATITDYMWIIKAEYYVDKIPKQFREVEIFGTTLTLDIDWTPSGGESVYLYCAKMHQLLEGSSTLKPHEEHVLIEGVQAYAAISKARSLVNKANISRAAVAEMLAWGRSQLDVYKSLLDTIRVDYENSDLPRN